MKNTPTMNQLKRALFGHGNNSERLWTRHGVAVHLPPDLQPVMTMARTSHMNTGRLREVRDAANEALELCAWIEGQTEQLRQMQEAVDRIRVARAERKPKPFKRRKPPVIGEDRARRFAESMKQVLGHKHTGYASRYYTPRRWHSNAQYISRAYVRIRKPGSNVSRLWTIERTSANAVKFKESGWRTGKSKDAFIAALAEGSIASRVDYHYTQYDADGNPAGNDTRREGIPA